MKIAIVGAGGVEGKSAYRYWSKQPGVELWLHDRNQLDPGEFGFSSNQSNTRVSGADKTRSLGASGPGLEKQPVLVCGSDYLDNLDKYDLVVHSPGIRPDKLGVAADKVTTTTREFFDHCPAPIIGVTGTKGKGTTATLIAKILTASGLKVHLVGNIGEPSLDELSKIKPDDWVVFELSSFQLYDLNASPHIAVHLMLEPDHLDWHKNLQEYARAKANIFRFQKPNDTAVYYAGSDVVRESAELSPAEFKIPYDRAKKLPDGAYVLEEEIRMRNLAIAKVSDVALRGVHMLDNVCASVAATWDLLTQSNQDKSVDDLKAIYKQVFSEFKGLPFHLETVANIGGVEYVNDSYSPNPAATIAALKTFDQPKVAILGGYDRQIDFLSLADAVTQSGVKAVVLVGQTSAKLAKLLKENGYNDYSEGFTDMAAAVKRAYSLAEPGDVILLSPGAPSFDMYTDFVQRGKEFNKAVEGLK